MHYSGRDWSSTSYIWSTEFGRRALSRFSHRLTQIRLGCHQYRFDGHKARPRRLLGGFSEESGREKGEGQGYESQYQRQCGLNVNSVASRGGENARLHCESEVLRKVDDHGGTMF